MATASLRHVEATALSLLNFHSAYLFACVKIGIRPLEPFSISIVTVAILVLARAGTLHIGSHCARARYQKDIILYMFEHLC